MEEGRKEGGGVREGGIEERRKEICSLRLMVNSSLPQR